MRRTIASFKAVFFCLALGASLPVLSLADTQLVLHVGIQNPPPLPTFRLPAPGDYHLAFSQKKARVSSPDGGVMILDFDKKVISTLDPSQKTFYQLKIDDLLTFGDKLPPNEHASIKNVATFEPTVGQESRTILSHLAAPFNLDLEAILTTQSNRPRRGMGRRRGGFPGFPLRSESPSPDDGQYGSTQTTRELPSNGCRIGGELWMANFTPGDCDRSELATAEAFAILRGAPNLKGLLDKIKKSNQTMLGATFSVAVLDGQGRQPMSVPVVSAEVKSLEGGRVEPDSYSIPGDYTKVDPPAYPLGSAN